MSIDLVTEDHIPQFERDLMEDLEDATRNMAMEFLEQAERRVISQEIPGPPLSPQTIAIKKRRGSPYADMKWIFEDRAVGQAEILTTKLLRSVRADVVPPIDRPLSLYYLLEKGGVNETGNIVPARPLWTTVAREDLPALILAFRAGFTRTRS